MHQLSLLVLFLSILFLLNACEKELDNLFIDQSNFPSDLIGKSFKGFVNQEPFGTNDIEVRIVEDELHFILRDYLIAFRPYVDSNYAEVCQQEQNFSFKIEPFTGLGSYRIDLQNDESNQIQWTHCAGLDSSIHYFPYSFSYELEEEYQYLQIDIEQLDIQNKRISGQVSGVLNRKRSCIDIPEKETVTLRGEFDTKLDYPLLYDQNIVEDTCAFYGAFRDKPFCIDNLTIKYSRSKKWLRVSCGGLLPYPLKYDEFSDCSRSYFILVLNDFEEPGTYKLLSDDEAPYYFELNQCFQYDIFLIYHNLRHFTNYFFLEIEEFDLEKQLFSANLYADFYSRSSFEPNKMTAIINSTFEVIE